MKLTGGGRLPAAAQSAGRVVLRGEPSRPRFDGEGFCYVEVGDGLAAYGSGDFFAYPAPRVRIDTPTEEFRRAKEEYEQVLDTWFNR